MLILNSSEKIQIRLVAAVATSQLDVICNYIDRTIASTATAELQTDVVTNDANAVDIIPAPAGTEKRLVKEISVYNADTASATVIIQRVTAGGTRIEIRVTLSTLEKLGYEDSRGWYILTSDAGAKRVLSLSADSATPSINTNLYDVIRITAQTAAITSFTTNLTGSPSDGDILYMSITGTAAVALTFGASFETGAASLPGTTVGTTRLDIVFHWNIVGSRWRCMAFG